MKIQPHTIEVDAAKIQAATNELTQFFNELCIRFGDAGMEKKWSLVFTPTALTWAGGTCYFADHCVSVNTVSIMRDLSKGGDLLWWKGLVVHEFCHALGFEAWFGFTHGFAFHLAVCLLLAKYDLAWDKTHYNLCESQRDDYQFRPKALFRMCRLLARNIHDVHTLKEAQHQLLNHFDTSHFKRLERAGWRGSYRLAMAKVEEEKGHTLFFERLFWLATVVAVGLSIRLTC